MNTICKAQFLDIWDLHIAQHRGLLEHFEQLKTENKLPSLDELITEASTLVHRYASDRALETTLCSTVFNKSPDQHKFKAGSVAEAGLSGVNGDSSFTGDRVLANTIVFRRDFLLYFELSDAIQEGDLGRVCEVLKVNMICDTTGHALTSLSSFSHSSLWALQSIIMPAFFSTFIAFSNSKLPRT
jgi:hypothetical protein